MMKEQRTFLVTGGAGFIGSNFVELLLEEEQKVIVLDALTYAGHRQSLELLDESGSFEFIEGSICDQKVVKSLLYDHGIDVLVNFAAESHVDRSIAGPVQFMETNITGTFILLDESCRYWKEKRAQDRDSFRFVQISTDEVYGSLGTTGKFSEQTSYAPNSPYSASKAAGDHLTRAWFHTYGLPTLTTNCSNNYGPRQFPEKLIPHMIDCALADKPLPVYGNGQNIRDWIHVRDHCRGVFKAIEKGFPGNTYCFGGNSERTNLEVVTKICSILDEVRPNSSGLSYSKQIQFVEDRLGHDWRYAIDDTKAQNELSYTRIYPDFEQGLYATIQWYLDHQDWVNSVLGRDI